ncbi:MAG: M20/M25/M40 family metallo-hydrolase [Thermoanaerobaculia bacterium]
MTDELADELRSHLQVLAADIGERNVWRGDSLARAADWIEGVWQHQGFAVDRQSFEARGVACSNLEVTVRGTERPDEIVLLGAHYDTVPGCPGANDNGTGVAALLEISRRLRGARPARTLRFVAFANEEAPFFLLGTMGSRLYAARARRRGDDVRSMVALETIGYYTGEAGSQEAPPLIGRFYPSVGNFLAFVGRLGARRAVRKAAGAFESASDFPAERVVLPALVPGVSWSDHRSFWAEGYGNALMVTDTALYRYPHYHLATDTPDRIDLPSLAEVTRGLAGMARRLAGTTCTACTIW